MLRSKRLSLGRQQGRECLGQNIETTALIRAPAAAATTVERETMVWLRHSEQKQTAAQGAEEEASNRTATPGRARHFCCDGGTDGVLGGDGGDCCAGGPTNADDAHAAGDDGVSLAVATTRPAAGAVGPAEELNSMYWYEWSRLTAAGGRKGQGY